MTQDDSSKFYDLLKKQRTAMLVTATGEGKLHARPMAVAETEPGCDLWFITGSDSVKSLEIRQDSHVNVVYQDGDTFISISGTAALVDDRGKLRSLWKEPMKVWFPRGVEDPNVVLLTVRAREGEYWDNAGLNKLKYAFEAAKAYVTGTTPSVDPDQHRKANL